MQSIFSAREGRFHHAIRRTSQIDMSAEWRISADDRARYETYFHQCAPTQGYLTGDQARAFFLKSNLSADVLRKIWDLADLNNDGRLDKREFAIACHLIASQVQKRAALPATLPPTLLADVLTIKTNGVALTPQPLLATGSFQFPPVKAPSLLPLTPTVRSKYLQQFHALVDVSKGNTFLNGAQARTLLQQTHLSQTLLHQIWNLADADRDGRLTADEFVVAMHCCDVARAGQTLPIRLPDDWSHGKVIERERSASIQLFDQDASTGEILRKNSLVSYEDKRQKNYQDGQRELERRRQMLREQEERDQREREERDKKREFDLQRQKEEQERLKQLEIERHLERQRQIEQQKEDERRKAFEQREAARKEMERRSRLEWERQRMQELSAQKSRLFEQINDFKSRAKAFDLEIQSMDESAATGQRRVQQNQTSVQTIDQAIVDLQKKTIEEKNSFVNLEQQRKDLLLKLKRIQNERETIETTYRQMSQSKGFDRQESDQMRTLQAQIQSIRQENTRTDEQIQNVTQQCQTYQRQMEQLRSQLTQLEQEAKTKNNAATAKLSTTRFSSPSESLRSRRVTFSPQASLVAAAAPARSSPIVDPFQNVDPFAFPTDLASPSSISAPNTISSIIQGDPFASSSPALKKREAPKVTPISNGKTSFVRYRALYDYTPTRPDELPVTTGDVILVNPAAQQSADWLEGQLENGKRGYFPANYAEPISRTETTTPASPNNNSNNRNQFESASTLTPGSWVIAVADCQGKTPDKHLTFQRGDPILVQTQRDNTWYSGQLHGKVGWFPRNHVRPATEQEIPPSPAAPPPPPLESPSSNNGNTNSGVAEVYVALHAYEATEPTDLSFGAGERITVLERDGDWWVGRIGQRSGTFPRNYVEKVETPQQETATAILPFQSFDEGRLSFEVGQLIYIRKKGDKGWYQGEIRNSDQPIRVGWFPANCVQNQSITSTQSYLNTTKENPRYIALFPYTAQQSDELSFPAEAILEVLDETDSNWFSARYNNQVGLVPATYVQPYHQNSSTTFVSTPTLPDSNNITTTSVSDAETSISLSSNPSRISAVRELIETEQRYIDDLQIVNRDFIDTLKHVDVLSDHESTQIFLNWQDLIVRNSILLNALKDQVDYKDSPPSGPTLQTPSFSRNNRSVSMSNITLAALPTIESLAQKRMSHAVDPRQRSFTPSDLAQASPQRRTKHRNGSRHRSPSTAALAALPTVQFDTSSASMTIHDGTLVGQILCEHLPQMSEDYFHYCNSRSQANRILQTKIDSSENFRTCMKIFQERNGGLSLNGFLTKPIQRVTRYPLLIEKILKHTPADHSDYVPVKEALDAARKINEQINQQISEQESQTRLDWLEQHLAFGSDDNNSDGYVFDEVLKLNSRTKYNVHRQLILHGLVMKVPGGKELLAFLFNDFLLFSTMKSSSSNWQTQIFEPKSSLQLKLYRMPILLMDVIIANDALNDQLSFSITTKIYEKPLVLKTQQTNVRTLWVKSINSAVEECQTAERSIMNDRLAFAMTDHKRDTKPAVARLLLVVQEAQDIMPSRINIDRHRSVDPYCEITVGSLALRTPFIKRTINPKWNAPMQFLLYDFHEDLIHISIFDHEFFSPNESLGSTSVHLTDILPYPLETFLHQPSLPFTKKIFLNNGPSVVIKFVIQLLHSSQ